MRAKTAAQPQKSKLGRIYKKWNKRPDGTRVEHSTWTVRYKGTDYATGETEWKAAEKFLLKKAGEIAGRVANAPRTANEERVVRMTEVFKLGIADARRQGNATADEIEGRITLHLEPFFGSLNAAFIKNEDYEAYIDRRLAAKVARSTINKELALLKRSLRLATRRRPRLIASFPEITMLGGENVRSGFLKHEQYVALKAELPSYLVPLLVAGYHVGSRRSELTAVELADVEFDRKGMPAQFRLWPGNTKNGEGRTIPIYGEMRDVLGEQIALTRREYPECPWLFHNDGERILTFYKAWDTAVAAVGVKDLIFHDLRRTAVRNMVRAGISRKVAMQITGHKTESVFERYNITDEADLADAASRMTSYLSGL